MSNSAPQQFREKEFAAWNEEMSRKYRPDTFHHKSTWLVRAIEAARVKAVIALVDAQSSERILEVGCGAGDILAEVPCGERFGVDLSDFMVDLARNRLGGRAVIRQANAEKLPFSDASFDKLICTEVLEHVQHPETVVAEAARVLRGGGWFVLSVPNDLLISRLKDALARCGIYNLLLARPSGYEIPLVNEWHTHVFAVKDITRIMQPEFRLVCLQRVPAPVLPLHFVFKFSKLGKRR